MSQSLRPNRVILVCKIQHSRSRVPRFPELRDKNGIRPRTLDTMVGFLAFPRSVLVTTNRPMQKRASSEHTEEKARFAVRL
jgi:hypothetical protein